MCETDPNPTRPTLAHRLAADAYRQLVETLRRILPEPPDSSPEYLTRRDNALIARFASLTPANPIEAEIAADYIAASEHARDSLRLALDPATSLQWVIKCRAQATSMTRQAHGVLDKLSRRQAERRKLEKDHDAAEQYVIGLIAQAFAEQPVEPDVDLLNQLEPDPDPDNLTPEQQKATIHRKRAALIRRLQQALEDPSFNQTVAQALRESLPADFHRQPARSPPR